MNEILWYYARDEQRFGPVGTLELKRLAERGQIAPGDLVWREGMTDWTPAGHIKGLFQPATAAGPETGPGASHPAMPQVVADRPAAAARPTAARKKMPLVHPVEMVLSLARRGATEAFVDASIRLFVLAGHWAMAAAMVLVVVAGAGLSLHQKSPWAALGAVATVPALAVLQYAAGQFCAALDRVNRSTRATVASTTLVDLIGLVSMLTGLILLLAIAAQAVTGSTYLLLLLGLLSFILCEHLAAVSLSRVDQNVIVADNLSPGEEALGTLCALLKASARVVPVAFGAGVCWSTILLLISSVYCLKGGDGMALGTTMAAVMGEIGMIAAFAALPMVAYLVFLLIALAFDVLDGLLTLRRNEE